MLENIKAGDRIEIVCKQDITIAAVKNVSKSGVITLQDPYNNRKRIYTTDHYTTKGFQVSHLGTVNGTCVSIRLARTWANLSSDAKNILEWVEHVWTGKPQMLIIKRHQIWKQADMKIEIEVTDQLFEEIKAYLPFSESTTYVSKPDTLTVSLKNNVKLH